MADIFTKNRIVVKHAKLINCSASEIQCRDCVKVSWTTWESLHSIRLSSSDQYCHQPSVLTLCSSVCWHNQDFIAPVARYVDHGLTYMNSGSHGNWIQWKGRSAGEKCPGSATRSSDWDTNLSCLQESDSEEDQQTVARNMGQVAYR